MTDFKDICEAFTQYQDAQLAYWKDLRDKTNQIVSGLEDHLGLTGKTFSDFHDGKMEDFPYVRLARIENGQFTPSKDGTLECYDLAAHFKLSVTMERGPEVYPKPSILINGNIRRVEGQYQVRFDTLDGNQLTTLDKDFSETAQSELYETIVKLILDKLDTDVFINGRPPQIEPEDKN